MGLGQMWSFLVRPLLVPAKSHHLACTLFAHEHLTQTGRRAPPFLAPPPPPPPEHRTNTVCHPLLEKQAPNDADDAGPPFSNLTSSGAPPTSEKWCSGPDGPRRLVFKNLRCRFWRVWGTPKIPQKPLCAVGICCRNAYKFWLGFGMGCERAPWRNGGPMMQGRRH